MNTSPIDHRPTALAAAATGLVGVLLVVTINGAHAIPDPEVSPAVVDRSVHTNGHDVERACFIKPLTWNEALDGPLPRCHTYVTR